MLKSYEAIYDHGEIRWLETLLDVEKARVIVTVLAQSLSEDVSESRYAAERVDQLLAETTSVWRRRSVSEIKAPMARQRRADWGND